MLSKIISIFTRKNKARSELEGQRYNDGILLIEQDNLSRSIKISAINNNIQKILGYGSEDLVGKDFREFLSAEEAQEINEFTEFEDGKKDFAEVISKMRYFRMLSKQGEYLPLRMRVVRSISVQNKPSFQLVINDDAVRNSIEESRRQYRQSMRGDEIFDEVTGLVSYESVLKDIEIISFYETKREIGSILVLFTLKNYEELNKAYSASELNLIRQALAQALLQCKREDDIAAKIADDKFLLILVETPQVSVSVPINRINAKFERLVPQIIGKPKIELNHKISKVEAQSGAEKQISSLLS